MASSAMVERLREWWGRREYIGFLVANVGAAVAYPLQRLGRVLIIEFVPKADPKVQMLLATREDIFPGYTQQRFETAFGRLFTIRHSAQIGNSGRILYLMERD